MICLEATLQGDDLESSIGALGMGGWGAAGGVNAYTTDKTPIWDLQGCGVLEGGGACGNLTKLSGSSKIRFGGGPAVGEGWFAGLNITYLSITPKEISILGHGMPIPAAPKHNSSGCDTACR